MSITFLTVKSPLMNNDVAPVLGGVNHEGKHCALLGFAGAPVALIFFPFLHTEGCKELLLEYAHIYPSVTKTGADIMVVMLENRENIRQFISNFQIPYRILSVEDVIGLKGKGVDVLHSYQVIAQTAEDPNKWHFTPATFLIDENTRIKKIYRPNFTKNHVEQLLKDFVALFPGRETREVSMQAPVLLINDVLSREECNYLMQVWETQGNVQSGAMRNIDGKTVGVIDYDEKIRRDHFIRDEKLLMHLDMVMRRRVFPQIEKAFHYQCTRREDYKIACYDGSQRGYFRKHRDHTTAATAHRVWAMSLNLNSEDYEGGYVKFPEFSDYGYKPKTGSALIFSGALMHEATEVHKGKRFVLLQFLYGEKEAKIREENRHLLVETGEAQEFMPAAERNGDDQ